MEKTPHAIGNYILPLKCSFGISRKYLPIWVSVSVFDRNQNGGYGRTLQFNFNKCALWKLEQFDKWKPLDSCRRLITSRKT